VAGAQLDLRIHQPKALQRSKIQSRPMARNDRFGQDCPALSAKIQE